MLTFDIECIPDTRMTEEDRQRFLKRADTSGKDLDAYLSLCAPTAQIVAVGIKHDEEIAVSMCSDNEKEIISSLLLNIEESDRVLTFNGRCYDFPVLLARAAAHGIKVPRDVVKIAYEYRFKPNLHIDISDMMTLFGAGSKAPLEAYCVTYGIPNPKEVSSGGDVLTLYRAGEYDKIAAYVKADVEATYAVYSRWMRFVGWN